MVILHVYLKDQGNIVATMPFRYNNGDDTPVEAREVVLEVTAESTYDSITQALMEKFDKEKQNGETDGQSSSITCITVV